MRTVGLVVEGKTDRIAAGRVLAHVDVAVDPARVVVTEGKRRFDKRIASFNEASQYMPWFALRDLDHDAGSCAVRLRNSLLRSPANPGLCFRVAARTLEAWLLADVEAVSSFFSVPASRVPRSPEDLDWPKESLVALCRSSRRRTIRDAMVPPRDSHGTGPEYTAFVGEYCAQAWRPAVAAENAPTLARAIADIRARVATGVW